MSWFDAERTSYLSWARANDEELYRARLERERASGRKPTASKPTVETFEYTPVVELLAQIFALDQQQIHAIHTHQTKAAKRKPKITRYPTPRTAAARVKKALAREAFQRMEAALVFSDEPYGPDSTLVRHSKLPASAGWAQKSKAHPGGGQGGARARPNRLRPPEATDDA